MIWGVLQRLDIVTKEPGRLLLRELPLLEWLIAGALFLGAINLAILGLTLTGLGALIVGVLLILLSRMRFVLFDAENGVMQVWYHYPLRRRMANEYPLEKIHQAYLKPGDEGYTQVILSTMGGELGLTVYSKDMRPWKEEIVFAINAFLHDARVKEDEDEDLE